MKKLALGLLAVTLLCGCGTKEAKISMEEAKEAALKEFQGDIIQSNKDEDDGKVVYEFIIDNGPNRCEVEIDGNVRYEIEIRDGNKEIDVEVDAVTKEILHYEEEIID